MSFQDNVKNNVVVWLLGIAIAGFVAGFGAFQTIISVSQNEIVSVNKLSNLQKQVSEKDKLISSLQVQQANGSGYAITSSPVREVQLLPGEMRRVEVSCPDRSRQRALGIDLTSDDPVEVDILKDSIWFVKLKNNSPQRNHVTVQLWCEKRN